MYAIKKLLYIQGNAVNHRTGEVVNVIRMFPPNRVMWQRDTPNGKSYCESSLATFAAFFDIAGVTNR